MMGNTCESDRVLKFVVIFRQVEVLAEVGDWFKVRWHKRAKEADGGDTDNSTDESIEKKDRNGNKGKHEGEEDEDKRDSGTGEASVADRAGDGAKEGEGIRKPSEAQAVDGEGGMGDAAEEGERGGTCVAVRPCHFICLLLGARGGPALFPGLFTLPENIRCL